MSAIFRMGSGSGMSEADRIVRAIKDVFCSFQAMLERSLEQDGG